MNLDLARQLRDTGLVIDGLSLSESLKGLAQMASLFAAIGRRPRCLRLWRRMMALSTWALSDRVSAHEKGSYDLSCSHASPGGFGAEV